eukprot:TRINITY_DN3462_c0_g1_i1.p1 TRINITY_DN3462_c0_g1~~TRINITY_DN3462_c0_g1_i1.p1  ORF type:complete len:257 (-),score=77.25 TRINITY_DN3462_c0_g1_i1:105-875(-)
MNGKYQRQNASLAIGLTREFCERLKERADPSYSRVSDVFSFALSDVERRALALCEWPGRSQVVKVPKSRVTLFLDGAHTTESMRVCRKWFKEEHRARSASAAKPKVVLVFNSIGERAPAKLLQEFIYMDSQNGITIDKAIFSHSCGGIPDGVPTVPSLPESGQEVLERQNSIRGQWQELVADYKAKKPSSGIDSVGVVVGNMKALFEELEAIEHEEAGAREVFVLVSGSLRLVGSVLAHLKYSLGVDALSKPSQAS